MTQGVSPNNRVDRKNKRGCGRGVKLISRNDVSGAKCIQLLRRACLAGHQAHPGHCNAGHRR
jgi:hypothetical protein